MSNFPNQYDDDSTLPPINDNITEIGGEAINALREAVFNIEQELGINPSGSTLSVADRLNVSIEPDGTLKTSALTIPLLTNDNIAPAAGILESKLSLDYNTQSLHDDLASLTSSVNANTNWISATGSKVNPHIDGKGYYHQLSHILVSYDINEYFKNRFDPANPDLPSGNQPIYRDNLESYKLFNDLNNDYLIHQKSDGYVYNTSVQNIYTLSGDTYPSNFAHTAGGIYLDSLGYNVIPTNVDSLQKLADFIDSSSALLIGSRLQNLFTSGISRVSRSSMLNLDGYGPPVVPVTKVQTYAEWDQVPPYPTVKDSVVDGDDIITFLPDDAVTDGYLFDSQFSQVKIGDVIRVNYGLVQAEFLVKEKRYIPANNTAKSQFAIRIDGKNILSTSTGYARIDRPTINYAKYGVLAVSPAQCIVNGINDVSTGFNPSLIVSHPRGAVALGNGFDASSINETNYNLYLILYPNGDITKGVELLSIDITGNKGVTPGKYTLDSVIESVNNAVRAKGYNYRFNAFSYAGQFGIVLSDSYNNAGFSIVAGELSGDTYLENSTKYPNNIIRYDNFGAVVSDPLGFGPNKANLASPKYVTTYAIPASAYNYPTKIFLPLRRNNYYVDGVGVESDKINPLEPHQFKNEYGDGYWVATASRIAQTNRVAATFEVPYDLSSSSLAKGKTLVVQRLDNPVDSIINYGRYIISDIVYTFDVCNNVALNTTKITVHDCIQGDSQTNGVSPPNPLPPGTVYGDDGYVYALYFNNDSVTFNEQNAFDNQFSTDPPYKRHFEIYVNSVEKIVEQKDLNSVTRQFNTASNDTFSLERGRMNVKGTTVLIQDVPLYSDPNLSKINIVRISPKLRGYVTQTVRSIVLKILSYNYNAGNFSGRLENNDGTVIGETVTGKIGEVTRFYDDTGVDYIDFIFDANDAPTSITLFPSPKISIQLFPSLAMDDEMALLACCQLNSSTRILSQFKDLRQFGNISEKDLSTSALNYISANDRAVQDNGVIRGFDISVIESNSTLNIYNGGVALVNGKLIQLNSQEITLPPLREIYGNSDYSMLWAVCANDKGDYELISLLDPVTDSGAPAVDRLLKAANVGNLILPSYNLSSIFFIDLIQKRKDLTPLYTVEVNAVNNPNFPNNKVPNVEYVSTTVKDVRRFINNQGLNNEFVWSEEYYVDNSVARESVAYFHSFQEVKNWINYYGKFSNTIKIRGTVNISGADLFSDLNYPTVFEGDGSGATIIINATDLTVGSYITFKNVIIKFVTETNVVAYLANYNNFENVTFTITPSYRISIQNSPFASNNKFINCSFPEMEKIYVENYNEFINCNFNNFFSADNGIYIQNNNKFINCTFNSGEDGIAFNINDSVINANNSNIFDGCIFSGILQGQNVLVFADGNKIINCNFLGDLIASGNESSCAIYLINNNLFENNIFGIINQDTLIGSANIISKGNNFASTIYVNSNNIIRNIIVNNILTKNSFRAIYADGNFNTFEKIIANSIASNQDCFTINGNDTTINECVVYYMQCHNGINISSSNKNIKITNNKFNYQFNGNLNDFIASDNIKSFDSEGTTYGFILVSDSSGKIDSVLIEKNKLYQGTYFDNQNQNQPCDKPTTSNPIAASYKCPPLISLISSVPEPEGKISNVVIEKNEFIGDSSTNNPKYAAIALINPKNNSIGSIYNVNIKDNISLINSNNVTVDSIGYNGLIISCEPLLLVANNINIVNNKLSYISYYFQSTSGSDQGILIEGNTCVGIISYDKYASGLASLAPTPIGNVIIDNNFVEFINVLVGTS